MKFSILLPLLVLAFAIEIVGVRGVYGAPQEGQYAACDNAGGKDSQHYAHSCTCARAKQECQPGDGQEQQEPTSECKTYCKPDNCKCVGMGCSAAGMPRGMKM